VVKVLDFGLVKSFLPERDKPQDSEITQAGVILGSPLYMAPEQARNVADPRSDVYSMGVVMFQLLVGRPPFHAPQSIDIIFKHLNEAPPSFASIWPAHDVPQEVEALVMRCLNKRPEDRFQSMDEVLEGIRRTASAAGFSGAFSSPARGAPGMGPVSNPGSGPFSGPRTGPIAAGASTQSFGHSGEATAPRPKRTLALALLASMLLGGLGVVAAVGLSNTRPDPAITAQPAPVPAPEPSAEPEPSVVVPDEPLELEPLVPAGASAAAAASIRVLIGSSPEGATVTYEGEVVGRTPLELTLPPDGQGAANARVTLSLDGYQRTTALVSGEGPVVRIHQKLQKQKKRTGSRSAASKDSSGYKDDPY
ncbi:MAG: protein kinase, partial [Cystobacter sp.]